MKTLSLITVISIASLFTTLADEQPPTATKHPTRDAFLKKVAELKKQNAKDATQENAPKVIAPIKVKKRSLLDRSTLIANNGEWTLLPKGSVIHTPDHLKSKIITSPGKLKILDWKTFLRKNHGWIHTHTVNSEQSRGNEKIDQESIKAYKTIGKVVIAINNSNPISVAPSSLKPEEEEKKSK